MFQLMLVLHVLGAIVAFGFGFAAPVIGRMVVTEPQHGNFFLRAGKRVGDRVLLPASLSMAVTGGLLIELGGHTPKELWLSLAMGIYTVALLAVLFLQRPTFNRLIALTSTPPGPAGPDPAVPMLARRLRLIGVGLTVAVTVVVALMVAKPAF